MNIFASYRSTKTLKDLHSRLPLLEEENVVETPIIGGCQPCKKRCVFCKNYFTKSDYAYSHQTETKFIIKSIIDCNTRNIIYIINDNICKISSVGYTADNMKTRFTNTTIKATLSLINACVNFHVSTIVTIIKFQSRK